MNRVPAQVFTFGEFLLEEIEARGWTAPKLDELAGLASGATSLLIFGSLPLTPNIAERLAATLDVSAQFLLNLASGKAVVAPADRGGEHG